jgi:hypothetical protein
VPAWSATAGSVRPCPCQHKGRQAAHGLHGFEAAFGKGDRRLLGGALPGASLTRGVPVAPSGDFLAILWPIRLTNRPINRLMPSATPRSMGPFETFTRRLRRSVAGGRLARGTARVRIGELAAFCYSLGQGGEPISDDLIPGPPHEPTLGVGTKGWGAKETPIASPSPDR